MYLFKTDRIIEKMMRNSKIEKSIEDKKYNLIFNEIDKKDFESFKFKEKLEKIDYIIDENEFYDLEKKVSRLKSNDGLKIKKKKTNEFRLEICSKFENVAIAQHMLKEFVLRGKGRILGLDKFSEINEFNIEEMEDLVITFGDILFNSMIHGYEGDENGLIKIKR